ncbi:hypothetical protein CPB84DRAFT_898704 [Gymnopilus junonius]|uniref:Uncharacterized protein n=1 Tax=Gymnopilus junonius TaxID=109634 RepID=A0A9P5NQH9_GYMJU|nr:hypothetical protein CPB84DRAFT_898704 [Gymnopilus junonius]
MPHLHVLVQGVQQWTSFMNRAFFSHSICFRSFFKINGIYKMSGESQSWHTAFGTVPFLHILKSNELHSPFTLSGPNPLAISEHATHTQVSPGHTFYSPHSLNLIPPDHLQINMCRWRQIQDTYAHCGHMYRLPDEMVYCPDVDCKFSPFHPANCPNCQETCWQYRRFPEQIDRSG